jgi:hypothetical protein
MPKACAVEECNFLPYGLRQVATTECRWSRRILSGLFHRDEVDVMCHSRESAESIVF